MFRHTTYMMFSQGKQFKLTSRRKYNCQSVLKIQMAYIFAGTGIVGINIHAMKVSIHYTN